MHDLKIFQHDVILPKSAYLCSSISKLSREAVERDLEFLGLVILENRLKKPTTRVITELREANIRVLMITGLIKRYQVIRRIKIN